MLVEVILFFGVVLKAWQFGWGFRLVENAVRAEFLWPEVLWDLMLTGGIVEWLVDGIETGDNLVGFVEGMSEIMELFGGG